MPPPYVNRKERIRELLLDAGTTGLSQNAITHAMHKKLYASEIKLILDHWLKHGAVQKFRLDDLHHRPITVWRATSLLAKTDESGECYLY